MARALPDVIGPADPTPPAGPRIGPGAGADGTLDPGATADAPLRSARPDPLTGDLRVTAVLAVLAGEPVADVALRQALEPELLQRWVRDFVVAGAAQVTNQPDRRAAGQRDRFLAAYAHETRTPLGVATGWASMLRDEVLPPADRDRVTARLCTALDRLGDRVEEMELLAATSLGRLELNPVAVEVGALVARVDPDAEVEHEIGDPTTSGPDPGAGVEVEVDLARFTRVLRDLWQTAATDPAPRRRWWQVTVVDPWVEIRARREADPIDVGVLGALFDPFESNTDSTGVTMGLYLARALAVAHGGTIGVDQNDTSAAFWVRVPRRRPAVDDDLRPAPEDV